MTYALDLSTLTVIMDLASKTTTGITFIVTQVPIDAALDKIGIKYRAKGTSPWSFETISVPISVNDPIALTGLTEETEYEAYSIAEDNTGDLSDVDERFEFKTLSSVLPAFEPVEDRILDNIQTTLQGITQGSEYFNTINLVERETGGPFEIANANKPAIVVWGATTDEHDDIPTIQTVFLNVALEIHFNKNFGIDKDARLLKHDVVKAILKDEKRGNNALDTTVIGSEVFHSEQSVPEAVMIVMLKIHFRHNQKDPAVVKC